MPTAVLQQQQQQRYKSREHKPLPTPKFKTKVNRDSNPHFWVNPDADPDVHRRRHSIISAAA